MFKFIKIIILSFLSFNVVAENYPLESMSFKNPSQPFENIITGGQPSLSDLDNLKELGITNIINLRAADEFDQFDESVESSKRNINYYSLEISGSSDITVENALLLDKLLKSAKGTTFIHCASSNRVGALLAIREAVINNKSKEEALNIGKKAGLSSLSEKALNIIEQFNAQNK